MGFNIITFLEHSTILTILVLILLSTYFIIINWIFIYRYFFIVNPLLKSEINSLESMLMGSSKISKNSFNYSFIDKFEDNNSKDTIRFSILVATKEMTRGLTFLSIVATTSPFIGLFGTVYSILNTFTLLGSGERVSSIAAGIGEALFVTSIGILVAIFAYSYHQILKRRVQEFIQILEIESKGMVLK